jgi:hypothetical protein
MERNMEVPQKLKIGLPYDLGIYLMECLPGYNRATCTPMSIAAVSTIAKL